MPSFDVVSELDMQEVDNAVNQAVKEVGTRYDFRGSNTEITRTDEGILIRSSDKEHVEATYKVLQERMLKRGVSLLSLDAEEIQPEGSLAWAALWTVRAIQGDVETAAGERNGESTEHGAH